MSDWREMADEELEFVHVLDSEGRCSCGQFDGNLTDPRFAELALDHFDEVAEAAVRSGSAMSVGLMVAVVATIALVVALALALSI